MGHRLRKQSHGLVAEDRKLLGRRGDPDDLIVAAAEGSLVRDARGRTFIDFQMGWCVGNLGWNNPEIIDRLRRFNGPSYVNPHCMYEPWLELARKLAAITPNGLSRSFRAVGGTESVELAMQLAMAATGREKLVSIEGAYHGNSFGARSIGGADLPVRIANCKRLALPLDVKALDRLETLLRRRDVAALVMEPIIMNLAVTIPSPAFIEGAAQLCERYGTLMVADEVACGFGRTGRMFASEHYELTPDIMCLAKAITSGHAPLGATLTTTAVADAVGDDFSFYTTYGWHPLGVEAALATLAYFDRHQGQLFSNVEAQSSYFMSRLLAMPCEGEIRIKGLAIGLELGREARVTRVVEKCREQGLLVGDDGDTLVMFPALTIEYETAKEGLDILEHVINES